MVERSTNSRLEQWSEALDAALRETQHALAAGEAQEAERRAKAVSAFAKAIRDAASVADFARVSPMEEDVDALRAELRRRIARYVEAERTGASFDALDRIADGSDPR